MFKLILIMKSIVHEWNSNVFNVIAWNFNQCCSAWKSIEFNAIEWNSSDVFHVIECVLLNFHRIHCINCVEYDFILLNRSQ